MKREMIIKPCVAVAFALAGFLSVPGSARAAETPPAASVVWPAQWTVFAPLHRNHPLLEADMLRAVPRRIEVAGTPLLEPLTLDAQQIPVIPGQPVDLAPVLGAGEVGATAYVFLTLQAPDARSLTLGLGADWWIQGWLNGEPFFDTLSRGNEAHPVGILNHRVTFSLRQGENILALRFIRGAASALLAVGDETHFDAEASRLAARAQQRALNTLPATLAERQIFPPDRQAFVTAAQRIELDLPELDLATGALAGLRAMPARQIYLSDPPGRKPELLDTLDRRFDETVTILLSKSRYPSEDRHLDAIVWTTPPAGAPLTGTLEILLKDAAGSVLARHALDTLSPTGWFFSLGFPKEITGQAAGLEAVWHADGREVGRASAPFHVNPPAMVPVAGRVPLRILNAHAAAIANAPMTVGVPFPRGALRDGHTVRLVDETGREQPLQTRVTARWSRFGPVKWLLCDFTTDVNGTPRELFLEFGSDVRRAEFPAIRVSTDNPPDGAGRTGAPPTHSGFPDLDAGRLRVDATGIAFDARGDGTYTPVLSHAALFGAFVTHADGQRYGVPSAIEHAVEELGPEKIVVRRTGWYRAAAPPGTPAPERAAFCNFITRFVFHRNSPVIRIFHTWIFTGDGNRDRIREMGWRFDASAALTPDGLLADHDRGEWLAGPHLVQHDYRQFRMDGDAQPRDGRTPGVLSVTTGPVRILFGAKDFWQNFPSEIELDSSGFTFYNWPRHNPPASFARPVTRATAFLHRFAHEGRVLDFRLPEAYAAGEIWDEACSRERHWAKGRPETANAQGIARTEEMFLYFSPADTGRDAAARVLRGLDEESLRAVADPAWVAASGVFGEIHPRDTAAYAADEHLYEQVVRAPGRWNERLGFYGMWLHGDVPAWSIDLTSRTVALYRAIRKNHHGWPVAWLPYARSGDPRLLKPAEAATRQMLDANFCHYASADVDAAVGPDHYRRQGWWDRSLLPWASRSGPVLRTYTVDCDYIWDAYYLTGYARARDVALLFGHLTQHDHGAPRGPRTTSSMLPSYLDMYQATFDPWFLAAAHEIARLHLRLFAREETVDPLTRETVGHFWRPADIAFHRFTGDDEYGRLALNHAVSWSSPRAYAGGGLWPRLALPLIPQAAYAYAATGNPLHLQRTAAYLDAARMGVYDGDLEYGRGSRTQGGTARGIFTGYYIRQFPLALGAFERAGYRPEPVPNPFWINATEVKGDPRVFEFVTPEVLLRKPDGRRVTLMFDARGSAFDLTHAYDVTGPSGAPFLSGSWSVSRSEIVEVPAAAEPGIYRVRVRGRVPLPAADDSAEISRTRRRHGAVLMPFAEPDVLEVMAFPADPAGTQVPPAQSEAQYWFRVPAAVTEFWIELPGTGEFGRAQVWNADGVPAVDHSDAGEPRRISIAVPPGHAGRLWRVTGTAFRIDPDIPPYFATSRQKWFDPMESEL